MGVFFGGHNTIASAAIATAATATTEIDKRGYAFGTISNDSATASAVLTWYAAPTKNDTPRALYDEDGVAVTQTVGTQTCHALPAALAGCAYVYPVATASCTVDIHLER